MLGRADAGYNLLIGNPTYISYLLFYDYDKLCSDCGRRVKGTSFTRPSTHHAEPSGVDGGIVWTDFAGVTWERGTLGGVKDAIAS